MARNRKKKKNNKSNPKPKLSPVSNGAATQVNDPPIPSEIEAEPAAKSKDPETIMCHYIPKWVLRHFRDKSTRENGEDVIWCYYVETGKLERPLIAKAYAKKNLFKNTNDPLKLDPWAIEKELSKIEGHASKTVSHILTMAEGHAKEREKGKGKGASSPKYSLGRKWLNYLRKFMFVMYYHQLSIESTYFDENHPGNAGARSWIQAFRKRENLSADPRDVWLHVLKYYLFTPHNKIIDHGKEAEMKRILDILPKDLKNASVDDNFLEDIISKEVDPNLEHWEAIAYSSQISDFYLAIWQAAPGEEFIMSDNSFGLYEGRKMPLGPLHRIYVVSPKIVLALCHVALKPEGLIELPDSSARIHLAPEHFDMSMLLNAPHDPARVTYSSKKMVTAGIFERPTYSEEDLFEFKISTLSSKDTHIVNAIILGNVKENGMVTFSSKSAVLRTLNAFGDNKEFGDDKKFKYASLVRELLQEPEELSSFRPWRFDPPENPLLKVWHPTQGPMPQDPQVDVPWKHQSLSPSEIPAIELPTRYHNSRSPAPGKLWQVNFELYLMLHEGNDWFCTEYKDRERAVIRVIKIIFGEDRDPGVFGGKSKARPARLVRSMNDFLASSLFGFFQNLLLEVGVDFRTLPLFREQIMIGLLDWLLKNNRSIIDRLEENAPAFMPRPIGVAEDIKLSEEGPTDTRGSPATGTKVSPPPIKPLPYPTEGLVASQLEHTLPDNLLNGLEECGNTMPHHEAAGTEEGPRSQHELDDLIGPAEIVEAVSTLKGKLFDNSASDLSDDLPLGTQNSSSSPPGIVWEFALELYRMIHEQDNTKFISYKAQESTAIELIEEALKLLDFPEDSAFVQPARLVATMDNDQALMLFKYFGDLFEQGGIGTETLVYRGQMTLGVLEWLLNNRRTAFDMFERTVPTVPTNIKSLEHTQHEWKGIPGRRAEKLAQRFDPIHDRVPISTEPTEADTEVIRESQVPREATAADVGKIVLSVVFALGLVLGLPLFVIFLAKLAAEYAFSRLLIWIEG